MHEAYKKKEREIYQSRKGKGLLKNTEELTSREHRTIRRRWRVNASNKRKRHRQILKDVENINTPPTSPDPCNNVDRRPDTMQNQDRKKVRKDRANAYWKIEKMKVSLFNQERLANKWKQKCQRMKKISEEENNVELINRRGEAKKALLVYQSMVNRIKIRYKAAKSDAERRKIATIVCANKILKRHRLCSYAKKTIGFNARDRRKKTKAMRQRSKQLVNEFLTRDDNSRMKATITRKGEKRQIRLLCYDMKTLHSKFLSETHIKISYCLFFCKLRPFNVIKPTYKDRETCLCRICQNIELKVEKCHQEKAIKKRFRQDIGNRKMQHHQQEMHVQRMRQL